MANMLTKNISHIKHKTCGYGYKCCDMDKRKHKEQRRSARRIEKSMWKKEI